MGSKECPQFLTPQWGKDMDITVPEDVDVLRWTTVRLITEEVIPRMLLKEERW